MSSFDLADGFLVLPVVRLHYKILADEIREWEECHASLADRHMHVLLGYNERQQHQCGSSSWQVCNRPRQRLTQEVWNVFTASYPCNLWQVQREETGCRSLLAGCRRCLLRNSK